MNDDLDLVPNTTDQYFFMNKQQHSIQDYLSGVDGVLQSIADTGDFEIGVNFVRSASAASRAVGLSMAKLLYGMRKMWESETDFFEYMQEFTTLSRLTMSRYIDAWEGYLQIPELLQPSFIVRPMKDLVALGSAISQGYIVDDELDKLVSCSNSTAFAKVLREDVKGAEPRSNSLTIYLEQSGDLVAWQNGVRVSLGYLNIQECDTNATAKKAVERIIKSSGILIRD
jgi:hypothetical protein